MKKLYFLPLLFLCMLVRAQTTETFETETTGSTSFTDNGQVFNITSNGPNIFDIYDSTSLGGYGWNGTTIDNKFIDNSNSVSSNVNFSISTANGNAFNLKSMYLYIAKSSGNLDVTGSITIIGSLAGVDLFTITTSSGFNPSTAIANGHTFIDMLTYGGQNNASVLIDKFTITSTGDIKYIDLDAMTWQAGPTCPSVTVTNNLQTNVSCNGGSNGAASVTASGGSGFTYDWTPGNPTGDGTNSISGLTAGTYTCTVTNSCGNSNSTSFTITQPSALTATTSKTDVSCNGGSNGTATVAASGGTTPYTYSWSPSGGTNATATGLAAGTYTVTVTDNNSCQITRTITVNQPTTALGGTISKTDVSCNGGANGTATVAASGGTSPYTYSWAPSGGTNATATGLAAGTYTVTVTDFNSCQITRTITVDEPTAFSIGTSQTNIACNGAATGSATVTVTGGTGAYTYSWSPSGGTGATASGLEAGTYTVTITDANTCQATQSFIITEPSTIAVTPSQTNVSCNGGANGTATATVSGGTGSYTYSWAPSGGTGATASGLAAGTYTVTITDANLCQATQSYTITQPSLFSISTSQTNVSCNGGSNGTATVNVTGGTPGYTYSWAPSGGTAATATGLTAGTYTVTITDANTCQATKTFTITQPAAFTITTSQANVLCNGGSTGSATVTVSGATSPYTYSWAPSGGTGATASGLAAGNYTVTITDANACQDTRSFTITEPAALTATTSQTNAMCSIGGQATINVSGGTGAYTYLWSPSGGTGATATGLAAGNYSVTATDAVGCTITRNFTITNSSTLDATTSQVNVSCNGGSNGSATVTATGSVAPYTYSWAPAGGTAATASGLVAGTYTVTITDAASCSITRTVTITQPAALVVTPSQTNVSCNGGSNGTATVGVTGGTGAYTYSWSPSGGTGATASGLAAGTYTVTITDANTCQATQSFTITEPDSFTITPLQTNVSCNGGSNGTASVAVTGGTGAYTYSWSPSGGTGATASGLAAGTYTVTITDANTCQATQSFTITQPALLNATASVQTNIACNGAATGSATVAVTGGTGAYTYSWAPSGGTGATATGLVAGTYTVTVTDNNGCTDTQNFTLTQPAALVATAAAQTNISCNGGANGTATVTVTGGTGAYTYSWAPSGGTAATATGLTAGTYTVTVTDNNGCTDTQSFILTQPSAFSISTSQTNISCNGVANGTATVSVTGGTPGYTYSWSPSGGTAATASGLAAGTYTVTITDANLCQATQSFTITQPAAFAITSSQTNVLCNGGSTGSATVAVTGGTGAYTYSWSPSGGTGATASGLVAGTYTVTITDANTCLTTRNFTITQPAALTATTAQTNIVCNGSATGSASVTVSGGTSSYTYLWSPSGGTGATASGLAAGNYSVLVTDANGCTLTRNFTLTQPSALTATTSQSNVSCNGGSNGTATVSVTGGTPGYTYSWSPSGGTGATASGLVAGTYTVTITDANLCQTTRSFTITQPAPFDVATSQTNVLCNGGTTGTATVTVSGATGPYTYSWAPSGGTGATASGLAAGTYTVTITDANTCQTTRNFTITQPAALTATTTQTNILCNGGATGSASVTVSGGTATYTYLWSPSGGTGATASGLTAGNYSVLITDANGCTLTQNFTLTQPSLLNATASAQTNIACNGGATGSATVAVTGGTGAYTYSWAPSGGTAATATGLAAGTYTVTVTDANGCTDTQSFTITQPSAFSISTSQTNVSCNGGSNGSATVAVTGGAGTYTYSWAPSGGTGATASGLTAGTYTVTITDANLCQATQSFTITQPAALMAIADSQTNVSCNGGSNGSATVAVTGGTGTYTYSWAPSGGTGATASGLAAGTYTVTITDANLCQATQSFTITQPAALTAILSSDNVTCPGANDGTAEATVSGGTAPYSYSWSSGQTTATISGLAEGTYTVTITDDNSCTFTESVTVNTTPDVTIPIADVAALPTVTTECAITGGTIIAPTATDNCAGVLTATTTDPLTYSVQGTYTITWMYDDGNGNTTTQTQSVVVDDVTAPVADVAALPTVTAECAVAAGTIIAPTAADNCAGALIATTTDPLTYSVQGTYTITWTYDDGNGNTTTQTQNVIVDDVTAPVADVATLPNVTAECAVAAGTIIAPTATDNCTGALTATTTDPLTYSIQGTYTITWMYDDGNGNTTTQTQTVVVDDVTAPVADVVALPTVTAECEVTAGTIIAPTATDNCAGTLTATTTDPLTYSVQGTYTITWTYDDGNGNTTTQTQSVIVDDVTAPVADVAALPTVTAECTVAAGTIIAPTATDNCAGTLTATTTDPLTYSVQGTYAITWTYDDGNGNTTTQTQSVVVDDVTAPIADVANLPDITNYCGVTSGEIIVPTATDNCAGALIATTSDPVDYTTEGTYTITWTFDDGNGNTITQTQNVIVEASPLDAVTFNNGDFTYNETVQSVEVNNLPAGAQVTYSITPDTGNSNGAVNAGIYTVTATVTPQPEAFNCDPITLTATLTINKAPQEIVFDPIPVKNLETDVNFQLDAFATSGLDVYYTFTYTSPDPAADVSDTGWVTMLTSGEVTITAHQDGNENYLPAPEVSQILVIESSNAAISTITIGDQIFENPPQEVYYLMDCGDTADSVDVTIVTETNATINPGSTFTINTPQPGIYSQAVTITSQDGAATQTYNVVVERRFDFSDIVVQKFDNVLLVNNNPQNNGGYEFTAYEWYKNGQLVGTGQYYSAGDDMGDQLDPSAEYHVKMTTVSGEVLQTCIGQILLQHSNQARLYPNPVATGSVITIEADFPAAELEQMEISIYSLTGSLVTKVRSSVPSTQIQLPVNVEAATYIVVLQTPNINKSFKLIVDK